MHAELELGRHAAMVGELGRLVAAHPERERLHAQRMLALHRCGLRTEALTAFHEAARVLDPSPELRSLEQAILQGDPALTAPVRPTAPPQARRAAVSTPPDAGRRGILVRVAAAVRPRARRP